MRIVLVEDEQRARRGLKNLIQMVSDDCEVVADAADGEKALDLISKCKPEVVFTDIKMPKMDGIQLIKEVRKEDPTIKFVIVSAYEEFDYARQALSLGVTEYLVKPLIMEDVEKVVNKLEQIDMEVEERDKDDEDIHPLIKKTLKMIEKNYSSHMSQKDVAAELNITPEYFCSLFAKEMGESYVKYIKRYRVEVAKTLLLHGDVSKDDVAEKVGYTDTKYFGKVFHEVTGYSISEFLHQNL
ncbi:MAG: response regulator [Pseudobutyrivibrio sp.]|nr:response regulator [Pseudobutyrivibrio sp.]